MSVVTYSLPSIYLKKSSRQKILYPLISIFIIVTLLAGRRIFNPFRDGDATEDFPRLDTKHFSHLTSRSMTQPKQPKGDEFYASDALYSFDQEPEGDRPFRANVAVLMETDPAAVPNLVPLMLHFASVLGPKWPVVLLTLEKNWVMPSSPAFRRLAKANQIRIMYLPATTTITDHHSVSAFLTEPWFWEQFVTAHRMLIFQADSILCSKAPSQIEDFLEWDLVGAPITVYGEGYNGGLSLRNPRLMLEIVRDPLNSLGPNDYEDQWFYKRAKDRGAHLPSLEEALKFAVETTYYDKPLGYHQPNRFQQAHWEEIASWCPEVGLLWGNRFHEGEVI